MITVLALGNKLYGEMAANLAVSVRGQHPIALVWSENALDSLKEEHLNLFSHFIEVDEEDYIQDGVKQYQKIKTCIDRFTPFEHTVFLDADTILFERELIFPKQDFGISVIGYYDPINKVHSNNNYWYWGEPEKICAYYESFNKLPKTYSGYMNFTKGELSNQIFKDAHSVYEDRNTPHTSRVWANGYGDEYCFNVALMKNNLLPRIPDAIYFGVGATKKTHFQIQEQYLGLTIAGSKTSPYWSTLYEHTRKRMTHLTGISTFKYKDKADEIECRKNW